GRCASYAAITRQTPTYSFPSAAGQSVPSVSTGSSSASARPPRCHSRSTQTCFAMPVGSSSPMIATTHGPCSTTLGTRTFSTRSGTPKWRPTGSKIFGGTDDDGGRQVLAASYSSPYGAAPPSITSPQTTARASSACAPAARSQCRPRSSAGSACAWTIAFRGTALREPGARQVLPSSQPGARSQPLEPPSFPEETQSHSLALRPSWF